MPESWVGLGKLHSDFRQAILSRINVHDGAHQLLVRDMLWIFSIGPVTTGSHKCMSPPCAFTTAVFVLSVNVALLFALLPDTRNGNRQQYPLAPALIRKNPGLVLGVPTGTILSSLHIAMHLRSH